MDVDVMRRDGSGCGEGMFCRIVGVLHLFWPSWAAVGDQEVEASIVAGDEPSRR